MPRASDARLFWTTAVVVLCAISLLAWWRGDSLLGDGVGYQHALVVRSIWDDRTIALAYYREQADALLEATQAGGCIRQDAFALGADGRYLPKHPLLNAVLAAPFYGLFGEVGFWLFNQAVLLGALAALRVLVRRALGRDLGLPLLLLVFGGTQVGAYVYGFHYDTTALMLVLVGFALYPASPFWGMTVLMLAVPIRPTFALLAPFLLLLGPLSARVLLRAAAGGVLVLGLLLLSNWWLWGHPLRTAYHTLPLFDHGRIVLEPHPVSLSLEVFCRDWPAKLWEQPWGLLLYNPVLLLVPFGWLAAWRLPTLGFVLATGLAAVVQCLVVFAYPAWEASHLGNRFLFAAIFLLIPAAALVVQQIEQRLVQEPATTSGRATVAVEEAALK